MRVVTVIGNRPQFVKAAAVSHRLRHAHDEILVHTGQHYDDDLSAVFFRELEIPPPEHQLALGRGGNAQQTGRMIGALDELLRDERPDAVLVYGDTNSTLAGGLAAAQNAIPVAHVEAGMRSYDRSMPEELNRVLTDHLADLLLVPTETAAANLARESVAGTVELVGDVMVDIAALFADTARADDAPLQRAGVSRGGYVLATAHRAGNVDDPVRLEALVAVLEAVQEPVVLPLHPRTAKRLDETGLHARLAAAVTLTAPLGYPEFTALLHGARAVLTDSGGVQKEAYLAGVPCVTLRDRTEWTETVQTGWNALVDLDPERAVAALARPLPTERPALYGDGRAGERVVGALTRLLSP